MPQNDQRADGYTNEQLRKRCGMEYHVRDAHAFRLKENEKEYALILPSDPADWMKEGNPILTLPPWDNPQIYLRCNKQTLLDLARRIECALQAK